MLQAQIEVRHTGGKHRLDKTLGQLRRIQIEQPQPFDLIRHRLDELAGGGPRVPEAYLIRVRTRVRARARVTLTLTKAHASQLGLGSPYP